MVRTGVIIVLLGVAGVLLWFATALIWTPTAEAPAEAPLPRAAQPPASVQPSGPGRPQPAETVPAKSEPAGRGAVLAGRLYALDSGEGFAGAVVSLEKYDGSETTETDRDGHYRFEAVSPGNWRVRLQSGTGFPAVPRKADQPGENEWVDHVSLASGEVKESFDFAIPLGVTISGKVISESGEPLEGAKVDIRHPQENQWATTVADGRFMVTGLHASLDTPIVVEREGFARAHEQLGALPAGGLSDVAITLLPESVIEGIVVDKARNPVSFPHVLATDETGQRYELLSSYAVYPDGTVVGPGREGSFRLGGLPSGRYQVFARKQPELSSLSGSIDFFMPQPEEALATVTLGKGERVEVRLELPYEIRVETASGPIVSGSVRDEAGSAIAGATITASQSIAHRQEATSDGNGYYQVQVSGPGQFSLNATAPGFGAEHNGELPEDTEEVDFVLKRVGGVHGRVLDADTGSVITTFEVAHKRGGVGKHWQAYFGGAFELVANANGEFTLENLDPRNWAIGVRADGYAPGFQEINVASATTAELEFRLERGMEINGRVLDPAGAPVARAQVFVGGLPEHLEWDTGNEGFASAFSDRDGAFRLKSLPVNVGTLSAYAPGYADGSVSVAGSPGATQKVIIRLNPGATIEGVVRYANRPVPEARLRISSDIIHGERTTQTDARGAYNFGALPAGEWRLSAGVETTVGYVQQRRDVNVGENATVVQNFEFGGSAAVEGYVHGLRPSADPPNVYVEWTSEDGSRERARSSVNEEGYYRVEQIPPGPAVVGINVSNDGRSNRQSTEDIELTDGEVVRQDLNVSSLASIRGRISARPGAFVAVAAVPSELWSEDATIEEIFQRASEANLRVLAAYVREYELLLDEPGAYQLVAVSADPNSGTRLGEPVYATVTVPAAGGEFEMDLDFR